MKTIKDAICPIHLEIEGVTFYGEVVFDYWPGEPAQLTPPDSAQPGDPEEFLLKGLFIQSIVTDEALDVGFLLLIPEIEKEILRQIKERGDSYD